MEYHILIVCLLFILIFTLEFLLPFRQAQVAFLPRWISNFSLYAIIALFSAWLFPAMSVVLAIYAKETHLGLFNRMPIPWIGVFLSSLLLLDFVHYVAHVLLHKIQWLWRLHQVHHTDIDLDLTTGFRAHPLEALLQFLINGLAIVLLGIPAEVFMSYVLVMNFNAFFVHGNFRIHETLDRVLKLILVTPSVHRIHHSTDGQEYNSNYGSIFTLWDMLFNTYLKTGPSRQKPMLFGLAAYREDRLLNLFKLLMLPFRPSTSAEAEPGDIDRG